MVAIVAGQGFGLGQTSARTIGGGGVLGNPAAGYLGSSFFVNAANGNVVIQNQDEILAGIGQDLVLSRTYNSLGLLDDDNGDNWRESAQRTVAGLTGTLNTAGSTITRTDWDGSRQVFTWNAAKSAYVFKDPAGAFDKLTYSAGASQWTWTDGDSRVVELYDNANAGRIVSSLDPDGKGQTFTYTGSQLTRITDSNGEYVVLAWSGSNLTQLSTYKSDNTLLVSRVRYAYDASNRLTAVTVDLSPSDNSIADGKTVVYTYTYDGTSKRVASIAESGSAAMVAFTYDQTTFKVTQVTETAASGSVRSYGFDYSVANRFRVTDSQAQVTDYFVDGSGRLTSAVYPTAQTIQYAWDAVSGRLASVTDALNNKTSFTYDANGNRTRDTDAAGNVVDRVYDAATNALLTETRYLVPDPDGSGAGTASSPVTTRYAYNAQNHLRFAIGAEGQVTEYRYDSTAGATWKLASTVRYTGNFYDVNALAPTAAPSEATMAAWVAGLTDKSTAERTDMAYDFRGNLSTATTYSAADTAGNGLTSAPYTVVTYVYDQFGLLLSKQQSGRTGSEVYTYDGLGRVLTSTDFAGNQTQIAYDNANRRTVMTLANAETITTNFNAFGQALNKTVAASGATSQVESYKYDNLGRLRTAVDALAKKDYAFYDASGRRTGYMDRLGNLTEYKYDAANRLVATVEYATTISAPNRASLFDGSGNPANVAFAAVRPTANAADLWSWNIYDAADRLIQTVASDGAVTQFGYDGAGRLVRTQSFVNRLSAGTLTGFKTTAPTAPVLPTADANDRITRQFYDKSGQQIGTLAADGSLTRSIFDAAGRVIETVQYASLTTAGLRAAGTWAQLLSSVTGTANPADRHQYLAYDDQGNLRYTLDANLRPTEFVYNAAGDAVRTIGYGAAITAGGTYSLAYIQGQITSLNLAANAATRVTRVTYDGAGRPAFEIDAEGGVTAYAYNSLNQVVKVTRQAAVFAAAGDQTLAAMQSWAGGNTSTNDRVSRTVYDALGRAAYDVDAGGYVTEHQYDAANRVTKDIRYPATYAVSDGVTQASLAAQIGALPAGAIATSYLYDDNGNRTQVTDGEGVVTTYAYDTFGRNTLITNVTAGSVTKLVYDALDRVVQRTSAFGSAAAASVGYAYDGAGNLTSFTDARGSVTLYTYDARGNRLTEKVPLYLDATPALVFATTTNQYDVFGNLVAVTDPRGNTAYYYYDKLDRVRYEVDREGYATETQYSIGGAILSVRRMVAKPTGTGSAAVLPGFSTSAADALTTFTRDKLDRVRIATDAGGYHEDYTLNAFGDQVSVRNKLGGVTANLFDKRGLLIQETLPVGSTKADGTAQPGGNIVNKFEYDASGNRTKTIEAFGFPEQRTTAYAYDRNGRLTTKTSDAVTVVDPNTAGTTAGVAVVETYKYDANDNLIEVKDAAGNRTLSYYDAGNRKVAQISAVGTLSTWTYDANGNVQTARIYGDAVALPPGAGGTAPSPTNAGNYRETVYTYDLNDRLLTTSVSGIVTGAYVATAYVTASSAIVTQNQYDAAGNVIAQTDAGGGKIFTYYDKAGHKSGQVDQAGYVTTWSVDSEGNVLTETRYATKYAETPVAGGTLPLPAADPANDRTTTFTYDKNGRRLTETRLNVQASTVSGPSVSTSAVNATITYTYNGLGLVLSKQEATGDTVTYGYDAAGRQTSILGQSFTDYTGATVTSRQDMAYDGLNNVTRSVENSARVTTYVYGAGGRLASSTDAAGNTTSYGYDAVGRVGFTSYNKVKSDGTPQWITQTIQYDAAGRQVSQKSFQMVGGAGTQVGDTTDYFYNTYGEVVARGTNSSGNIANAQEFNEYDKAGRVWRTNFGDGVTKAYIYDKAGNATLLLQSLGSVNLKSGAFPDASAMLADTGIGKTISVFDARNQLIDTIQATSNNLGASPVHATQVGTTGSGTAYFNSSAGVGGTNRATTGATPSTNYSYSTIKAGSGGSVHLTTANQDGMIWNIHVVLNGYISNGNPFYIRQTGAIVTYAGPMGIGTQPFDQTYGPISGQSTDFTISATKALTQTLTVYQEAPGGGQIVLAKIVHAPPPGTYTMAMSLDQDLTVPIAPQIQFQNENPNTEVVHIFGRQQGTSDPYQWLGVATQMARDDGSPIAGWYKFDTSALLGQSWDFLCYALDGAGHVLDAQSLSLSQSAVTTLQPNSASLAYASQGEYVGMTLSNTWMESSFYTTNWITGAEIYLRPAGSGQSYAFAGAVTVAQSDDGYGGLSSYCSFRIADLNMSLPGWASSLDFQIVYKDGNGNAVSTSTGVLSGSVSTTSHATYSEAPLPVNGPGQAMTTGGSPYNLVLTGFPPGAANLTVYTRALGSGDAFAPVNAAAWAYGQLGWWSVSPPPSGGPYEFWVEPRDANGNIVGGRSYGTFSVGGQPSTLTQYAELPKTVTFTPPSGHNVTSQRMRYFANGSWSGWINYNAGGVWSFDAGGLAPDFYGSYGYQVEYETYDGQTMLSRATGTMALGYNGESISLANQQGVAAKVQFNPLQTAGNQIRLFWRDAGSTGAYAAAVIDTAGGSYAWDVDAAGARPTSGTRTLEYYYDIYDASGNLLPTLAGSDHVQGKITISSDGYADTAATEIRWVLDTATASQFLIHRSQAHNAFGEISSETDGRGNTTDLAYNTEGKLTRKTAPLVAVTDEAGVTTSVRPVEYYYYDKSGRQVAQRDANGNLTTQTLLAGTGYGGGKALATAEYRPGSTTTSAYDVYGDQRVATDGNGAVTTMAYDANHNLIEVRHPVRSGGNSGGTQLIDYYAYDALGERIRHWNSQLGAAVVETTDYDASGRVTRTVSFGGQATDYTYTYFGAGTIATAGLGTFGGWRKTTATSAGITQTENQDIFGRATSRTDYGGHTYAYTYDIAGRLAQQTNSAGQNIQFAYYENGYVRSVTDVALKLKSTFEYDNDGNRTLETYNGTDANAAYYQNAAITYDAMNRMTRFLDAKADITYKYDAAGNRRNVRSVYQDGVGGGQQTQDFWYKYDGQNRFVLTMGTLSGGVISRGTTGVDIAYDAAGNRATATYGYDNHGEAYTYTADGYLEDTYISGVKRSSRTADAMGRTVQYTEYAANGATATLSRASTFDNDNRVTADTTDTVSGSATTRAVQTYDYRLWTGSGYSGADQGVLTHVRADNFTVGQNNHMYTDTNTYYTYWDEAKQSSIRIGASNPNNPNSGQWAPGMSSLSYDVNGHIATLVDQTATGGATTVKYRNDAYGQVLVREESKNGVIGPRQLYYYFAGTRIGDVGNNGPSPSLVDYAQALAARGARPATSFYRGGRPVASADFDENYQPINAGYPGGAASTYTVRDGDTLYTIARALWGDQAMWFLIAEANGLSSASQLVAGQRLIIPNKVTNFHNTSGTFRVYDPGEAIGDTMPTLPNEPAPPPAKKKGCGGFGAILLAIIAIVVAVVATAGTLALATGQSFASGLATIGIGSATAISGVSSLGLIAAGAVGGAVGSAVSQGIGVATGLQDSFSWKAVGLAALGGAVGGAAGPGGLFGKTGLFGGLSSKVVSLALRGAVGNVATQGIGVATGLQDRFDWAGVAAAGVGAGAAQSIKLPGLAGRIASNMAGGLAASAAESLITGRDFGDTLMSNLPGMIANTIGNLIADSIGGRDPTAAPESKRFAGKSVSEIADLRIRDAARASGNKRAFLTEVGRNPDLHSVFIKEARIIAAARDGGYSLNDAAAMIGTDLHPGASSVSLSSADETVITGNRTFGDAVANTLVVAQDTLNGYTEGTRDMIGLGLAVLRGGPVGAIGGYAINEAIGKTLSATGLDQQVSKLVAAVGSTGLSILSSSPLDYEFGIAEADGRESGLFVEAGSTILGISALGKLRGAVVRGEGGRFGDLHTRRVSGDDLTPHHIPQAGRGFTSYADGGAVVMTTGEHALTRTYKARGAKTLRNEADLPFRDTLARDIRDVRSIGGSAYNKGLQNVADYYRKNHPKLMKKGQ